MKAKLYNINDEELQLTGDHPDLIAGRAGNLDGKVDRESNYMFTTTAGIDDVESGNSEILNIKGESIAWNQLCPPLTGEYWESQSSTYTPEFIEFKDGIVTVGCKSDNGSIWYNGITIKTGKNLKKEMDHLFLLYFEAKANFIGKVGIDYSIASPWSVSITEVDKWQSFKLGPRTWNNQSRNPIICCTDKTFEEGKNVYSVRNVMFFDLTFIYGPGNEPSTIEEFEADYQRWFGKQITYEEYDTGSIRNVKAEAIKTTGFNLYKEGDYIGTAANWYNGNNNVLWKNDVGYNGQMHITFDAESTPTVEGNSVRPMAIFKYTDGTSSAATADKNGNIHVDKLSTANKIIKEIKGSYGNSGTIKLTNICINFSWSGKRDGEYEPYWEEIKPLPITSLKGKLNGEGESVVVFPDGMKKAGTAFDEIKIDHGILKAIKRIGTFDLGDATWSSGYQGYFTSALKDKFKHIKGAGVVNILSPHYNTTESQVVILNKSIYQLKYSADGENSLTYNIGVQDSSFENKAAFTEGVKGRIIYYELATPEEYILDEAILPLNCKVDDFGTIEVVSPENSIAPTLTTRWGINAVDALRRLPDIYTTKESLKNNVESLENKIKNISNLPDAKAWPEANQIVYVTKDNNPISIGDDKYIIGNEYYPALGYGVLTYEKSVRLSMDGSTPSRPFYYNKNVVEVILPELGNHYLPSSYFCGCYSLTKVSCPSAINITERSTFSDCRSLHEIWPSYNLCQQDNAFYNCKYLKGLENITVGNPGNYNFAFCTTIKELTIMTDYGNSKLAVGIGAFEYCTNIEKIYFKLNKPTDVITINKDAFLDVTPEFIDSNFDNINNFPMVDKLRTLILRYDGIIQNLLEYVSTFSTPGEGRNPIELVEEIIEDEIENEDQEEVSTLDIPVPIINYTGTINNYLKIYVPEDRLEEYQETYPTIKNHFHPITGEDTYLYKKDLSIMTIEDCQKLADKLYSIDD
ncbi:MAG: leucine-rich repeat protein [Erysipelotrichales bacterium]|nr:leucine-rich repeat protein [Erysipelotrichales bacterium]